MPATAPRWPATPVPTTIATDSTSLLEHALGTSDSDPSDTAGAFSANIEPLEVDNIDSDYLIVSYQRNLAADDVEMRVEISLDVDSWNSAPASSNSSPRPTTVMAPARPLPQRLPILTGIRPECLRASGRRAALESCKPTGRWIGNSATGGGA